MSRFVLKWIALFSMIFDHAGILLFSDNPTVYLILRSLGRVGFPIFAYFVAEGFRYTHSRIRYFFNIFLLGVLCQIGYAVTGMQTMFCALITFSFSLILMALADGAKRAAAAKDKKRTVLFSAGFLIGCTLTALFCHYFSVDYGFIGVMIPVLVSCFEKKSSRVAAMCAGLLALSVHDYFVFGQWLEFLSLTSIPIFILYNGKTGKYRMKYFFYLFYPLHFLVLAGIGLLLGKFSL